MHIIIVVAIAAIIYIVQQRMYERLWDKSLKVSINFLDNQVIVGGKTQIVLIISNAKKLPLPILHVKFSVSNSFRFDDKENASITDFYHRNDVFSVMANQKITRNLSFVATKRGYYDIDNIVLVAKDLFLTKNFTRKYKKDYIIRQLNSEMYTSFYVFPNTIETKDFFSICNTVMGELEMRKKLIEDPYTFRGIREYSNLDVMNKINWKASAKNGELMVNLYNNTSETKIKIIFNMDSENMIKVSNLQEICISLCSSFSEYFLSKKQSVMVTSNGKDMITDEISKVDYGTSINHSTTINKYLARIGDGAGLDSFMEIISNEIKDPDPNVFYLIISPYHKDDLLLKLDYMIVNNIPLHLIVPHYDISNFEVNRNYISKWEVNYNEA